MTPDLGAIRILVLDVDGVLTDGRLYVGEDGEELKAFSILDGAGIKLWTDAGRFAAVISGHASKGVKRRFERLGLEHVTVGVIEKVPIFEQVLAHHGLEAAQAAVMGDDVMDLGMMRRAGFRATVPAAHPEVLREAHYVTNRPGGRGAVREVIDLMLRAQGLYDAVLRRFAP